MLELRNVSFSAETENGTLETLLHYQPVKPGEIYYIPAGLVHAIGENILIAEIQQNSNTTYRIYDYNRRDKDGKARLRIPPAKAARHPIR